MQLNADKIMNNLRAQIRRRGGKPALLEAIATLDEVISKFKKKDKNPQQNSGWAELVVFRAGLQIEAGEAYKAANFLRAEIQNTGNLNNDVYAHIAFANASLGMKWAAAAVAHLRPNVQSGGLLFGNPTAHVTFAKALSHENNHSEIVEHLQPLVQTGAILFRDRIAQTIYVNALSRMKKHEQAYQHMVPLMETHFREDSVAKTTFANLLIRCGDAEAAVEYLMPMVRPGAPLRRDEVARNTYEHAVRLLSRDRKERAPPASLLSRHL